MGRVTVRFNHLPDIVRDLPDAVDKAVDDEAKNLADDLSSRVWRDTGAVSQATYERTAGANHAEVWCGINRGKGFYSRFQEWGTVNQAARPIVGPTAHEHEPQYAKLMGDAVRKACRG